mmetsp:Transcript_11876/g.19780  ORF Transcript_11876/g.19780 Transcript_11876/m.19780 type:complete len:320 (+) Transcript_11876:70-1029(+)
MNESICACAQYYLRGGEVSREKAEKERKSKEDEKEAQRKEKERKLAEEKKKQFSPENLRAIGKALENDTGVLWSDSFTDVDDDGNCQMHCVWLGLRTLILHYPGLSEPSDKDLGETPEAFREDCFRMMAADNVYQQELVSTFKTYVEDIDGAVLKTLEDFFTLPDFLRSRILETRKKSLTQEIKADYAQWARDYTKSASGHRIVNGRKVYYPLGVSELRAISRLLNLQLHVMTKNSVLEATNKGTIDQVDPRTVSRNYIQVFGIGLPTKRVVRLMNIDENHYHIHLPRPPKQARDPAFDEINYWKPMDCADDGDELPEV